MRQGFFEEPEYRAIAEALLAPLRPVATFLYLTGWRVGEVLPLTWKQIDLGGHVGSWAARGRGPPGPGTAACAPSPCLPELETMLRAQWEHTDRGRANHRGGSSRWCSIGRGIRSVICAAPGKPPALRPAFFGW